MTDKQILLVEDHAAYKYQFELAFPDNVDIFHSAEDYLSSRRSGYDYAFVDFALSPGRKTGFSVILHLQATSPNTRIVVFNEVADSGRILFNIAAMRWFGVWGMMTKGAAADVNALSSVAHGVVPTPDGWRRSIHDSGFLIDGLFERPEWLDIWPVWVKYDGRADAVLRAHPDIARSEYQLRTFSESTSATVESIEASLITKLNIGSTPRQRSERVSVADRYAPVGRKQNTRGTSQVRTVAFAQKHYVFFDAVDLRDAVRAGRPWERR